MEFFALDDQVAQLERDLSLAKYSAHSADSAGSARLHAIIALAWQLRQRDAKRALTLVDEAQGLLADAAPEPAALGWRLMLIQAEVKLWLGELDAGTQLVQTALQGFIALHDALGCADAYWLLAGIALTQADVSQQQKSLTAMAHAAVDCDLVRYTVAQAGLAGLALIRGDVPTWQHWQAHFSGLTSVQHPAAACWVEGFLGQVALAEGQYAQAFKYLNRAYTQGLVSGQIRWTCKAANSIGVALSNLNEHQSALEWMQRVLDLTRPTEWPTEIGKALINTAITLYRLQRYDSAHALLQEAQDYPVPAELYGAVAREYARLGQHQEAYQYALQASAARAKMVSREVLGGAIAIQVHHQTEQTRIEAEHHRQLAASGAQRASVLQHTKETLEHLSKIGQEITAHLDANRVFEVLERQAHHLLEVDILALYLMDAGGQVLQRAFFSENYQFAVTRIRLDDPVLNLARCVRERREIFIDQDPAEPGMQWDLPCPPTLSRLFAPLCVADKILGAITIQSFQRHVYGQREQLIFSTLAAYAAIALANAQAHGALTSAHQHLQKTWQQMRQQSKMAGLGSLTVGVANEINNPVNFAHVAAQNLGVDSLDFEAFLNNLLQDEEAAGMSAMFAHHFSVLNAHIATMLNGTGRIKGIVQDLRAFSRAGEAEKRAVRLSQCLHSTLNLVRSSWSEKVEFSEVFDDDPLFECWPALLNQVFMNLLVNGCQAIEEKGQKTSGLARGKLSLSLKCVQCNMGEGEMNQIEIAFQDNGVGIDPQAQTRVMEPFYTTKAVGSGTGLGLSIAYEIVQKHGGHLHLNSTLGVGSCFTITLPLPPKSANPPPQSELS